MKLIARDLYLEWTESLTRYMRFPLQPFETFIITFSEVQDIVQVSICKKSYSGN